jgi:hypothetical protein
MSRIADRPGYTRARLESAAAQSSSLVDMLHRLGQPLGSGPLRYLGTRLAHYGIRTEHFAHEPLPKRAPQRYSKEILETTAADSRSIRDVMERLGVPPYDTGYTHIKRKLVQFGIDTSHFTESASCARREEVDETELRTAVAESESLAGVMRRLGLPDNSTSRRTVKKYTAAYGLTTAHFTGQGHYRGRPSYNRKSADGILRQLEPGASRTRRMQLHRALQEMGMPYVCEQCGTGDLWQGQRLVLEIDHINGYRLDNRIENLRYLCPSCHSQTGTFAGRSRRVTIPWQAPGGTKYSKP